MILAAVKKKLRCGFQTKGRWNYFKRQSTVKFLMLVQRALYRNLIFLKN